mmetsp:Transcript_134445/g.429341  ORF Transcript_134445/g.429341 Transcript_134445/m.429341 type:complete len:394 (-) Transcript_134445:1065-2246(-)
MPIQRLPEGPADGHVGVPGKRLRDDLGRLRKIELVQVQIHTLWGCGEARRSQLRGQRKRPQRPRQAARRGRGEREAAEGAADAAEAGELPGGAQDEALGARRHQRRGRPNPQRRPSREHGGGPATPRERGTAGQAAATAHGCAREAEAIDAEVHTPVQAERHLRKVLSSLHRRSELSVLHREMGEAAVVPQLRYLHTARWRLLQCEVEPLLAQTDAGFQQVLCHDRSLCNLAQLADHAPALGDEVEVSGEGFCVPDRRGSAPGPPRPASGRAPRRRPPKSASLPSAQQTTHGQTTPSPERCRHQPPCSSSCQAPAAGMPPWTALSNGSPPGTSPHQRWYPRATRARSASPAWRPRHGRRCSRRCCRRRWGPARRGARCPRAGAPAGRSRDTPS